MVKSPPKLKQDKIANILIANNSFKCGIIYEM